MRSLIFLILGISFFFHIFNLNQPNQPVFDEAHFVTYAVAYANHQPHFDIHPPLGKVIYSLPLFFLNKQSYANAQFIILNKDPSTNHLNSKVILKDYQNFPYIILRLINVFFGLALILAVYLFIKTVSGNTLAALLGSFFIAFENAILLETRLILLNGMYIVLGFLALTSFLKEDKQSISLGKQFLAGSIWGLALSVKLVAIVFLGPVIIYSLIKRRNFWIFFISGLSILFLGWFFINILLVNSSEWWNFYNSLIPLIRQSSSSFLRSLQVFFVNLNISLSGYTSNVAPHPDQSQWYQWPFMIKPIKYLGDKIMLISNPVVWFLALAGIVYGLIKITKLKKERLILLSGYVFSLVPFIFIERPKFLYHYFPALIFGISLTSIFIAEHLESLTPPARKKWLAILVGSVILAFIIISPFTFGL